MNKIYKYEELENIINNEEKVTCVLIDECINDITDDNVFENISKFKNINTLIINSKNPYSIPDLKIEYGNNKSFSSKIALLNKLSEIEMQCDMDRCVFMDFIIHHKENLFYNYGNNMLFLNLIKPFETFQNITHLNVCNVNDKNIDLLNNLNLELEFIHVSCFYDNCNLIYKLVNLPITLKKLSITLIQSEQKFDMDKMKIPFGCELEYEYSNY